MKTKQVYLILLLWLIALGSQAQKTKIEAIDEVYIERDTLSFPIQGQVIKDGDVIAFDIPAFGDFMSDNHILLQDVHMMFNSIVLSEFPAFVESLESGVVRFEFSEDGLSEENRRLLYNLKGGATKKIKLGIKAGDTSINFGHQSQMFFSDIDLWGWVGWVMVGGFFLFFLVMIYRFDSLLRDELPNEVNSETAKGKSGAFSFGKSQMAFWTFIIIASFIYIWAFTTDLHSINATALILLGISSSTLAAAATLDNQKTKEAEKDDKAMKDLIESRTSRRNFFKDILSDKNGMNINRFQVFIFNIVFGVAFIKSVTLDYSMPTFDETQLLLLGLSNGTYVLLKTTEKK
ncbi:hypothetical protein [Chryseolinea soli]|uniref:Uncharacterized protein n=1 Tax=Chryseolinea soli TaxID=2321403 RepID=A0A385SNU1_9BACT|nr:hypothetical protein [Chryseolinea soli]AYB32186.1 hypothetical protein D4L85_17115 [Chryseolinea soli]